MRLFLVYLDNGKIAIIHAANITAAMVAFYGNDTSVACNGERFEDMGLVLNGSVIYINK